MRTIHASTFRYQASSQFHSSQINELVTRESQQLEMSWWSRSNKHEPTLITTDYLQQYYKIASGIDDADPIQAGDYVQLKSEPFLAKKYARCLQFTIAKEHESVYGYVLSIDESKKCVTFPNEKDTGTYVPLGTEANMRIAVLYEGDIGIIKCDSRLFCRKHNLPIPAKLAEFAADAPIATAQIKAGLLVRPRAHVQIRHHHSTKLSSIYYPTAAFQSPLIILGISDGKVTLGGMMAENDNMNSGIIQEVRVEPELLCEYSSR